MPKRRLLWQLLASFALAGLGAVALSAWLAVDAVEDGTLETARADLKARARFLIGQLDPVPADDGFKQLARGYNQATGIRVALLLPDGQVNFDSQDREQELEGPQGRPEIDEARALHWLREGAEPSETTAYLLNKLGILPKFLEERPGHKKKYKFLDKRTAAISMTSAVEPAAAEAAAPEAPVAVAAPAVEAIAAVEEPVAETPAVEETPSANETPTE